MRHLLQSIYLILFFILMFLFPDAAFDGATSGLLLWFNTVFPTLFPFMLISSLIIQTNTLSFISKLFGPVFKYIFHISEHGVFAVLGGFCCGYPMGAKITAELVNSKRISEIEGSYLLSFCNNTSPMFVLSFILMENVARFDLLIPGLCIFLLSPFLCSYLFYALYYEKIMVASEKKPLLSQSRHLSFFQILDDCIMKSIESIVQVGGYIIAFSILITLANTLIPKNSIIKLFLISFLEMTNGIVVISSILNSSDLCWILTLALASFGGFCACAQTSCMINGTRISTKIYIIEKLITAIVTSLLAFLYLTMQRIF